MNLWSLEPVTKELQHDTKSLGDIRDLLNAVMKEFCETNNPLYTNSSIILCPLIESAIVKTQGGNFSMNSRDEKKQ